MIFVIFAKKTIALLTFFKKSVYLKDLIPNNFADIHSHLLPNIDDGSKSIENTISMIEQVFKLGFSSITTTPHIMQDVWENTKKSIEDCLDKTNISLFNSLSINPIKAAAEYMIDGNFVNLLKTEKLLTLKDKYILVEMSYINAPLQLYDIIFDIQVAGYKPILAHPERYNFYHFELDEYKKLKRAGCKFQLNLLSTVGYYGANVAKTADYLLKENLIDFVGSDIHHQKHIDNFENKIVLKNIEPIKVAFQNNSIFGY